MPEALVERGGSVSHHRLGLLVGGLLLVVPAAASAAPVTVNLRIEGKTRTLYEGPVTTDVRPFHFTGDATRHPCDGTAATGGSSPTPVPVRNNALQAAIDAGLKVTGTWSSFGPTFDSIDGESTAYDAATSAYLVEYKNNVPSELGGCSDPIASGDDVLYAYGTGSEPLLAATGPATVKPGAPVTVHVADARTNAPVSGATIGGATTGADGNATLAGFSVRGPHDLKATQAGAIRSNRLAVCVTDGSDGACATEGKDATRPWGRILGLRNHHTYGSGDAPRRIRVRATDKESGVKSVRVLLRRRVGTHCSFYSDSVERFVAGSCARRRTFDPGTSSSGYLLPRPLPRGDYLVQVITTDKAGNVAIGTSKGRGRVVFRVR